MLHDMQKPRPGAYGYLYQMISIDYKKISLDAGGVKSLKMTFLKSKNRYFYNLVIT
jgi:hypothetical protein